MAHITDQKHLQAFILGVNIWNKYLKAKTYDHKSLSKEDVKELLVKVDYELSPENLTCDGQLTGNTLKLKAAKLNGAKTQLLKL